MRQHLMILTAAVVLAACGTDTSADMVNPGGLVGDGPAATGGAGGGGGGGTSTKTLHCLFTGARCDQTTAVTDSSHQSAFETACGDAGGTFGTGNCPTSGTVAGYCAYSGDPMGYGLSGTDRTYYYTASFNASTAASACASSPTYGTWVP
jgi:hypothetical protein